MVGGVPEEHSQEEHPRDVVARDARVIRLGADFRWPGARRVAVVFNVAFEAWSDGKAPGLSPMGNPLAAKVFDTNALSWGNYGPVRGMARLLRALAERAPATVKQIAAAGHDIVAHGYAQDVIPGALGVQAVEADIARTTETLAAVVGARPTGWISPRGTPSRDSARLLVAAGYQWQGDAFDDDRPYVQEFDQGRIVAIPLTMEINDLPHAMRHGRSPRQFVEEFDAMLGHVLAAEDEAIMIDVTAHAHCYGRPSGAWAFEAVARKVMWRDDVWVGTRAEIASHVLSSAR